MKKYIWNHELTLDELNSFFKNSMGEQLGMQFIEIGPDYLKATMPVDHRTMQPMGFLHGGASVALAESMGSVGAWLAHPHGSERQVMGLEINANHLKAVTRGVVTAVASPIRQGSTVQVWKIDIFDDQENLVCTSRITTMALKTR